MSDRMRNSRRILNAGVSRGVTTWKQAEKTFAEAAAQEDDPLDIVPPSKRRHKGW